MNNTTRKLTAALVMMLTGTSLWAATNVVDGITYTYTISEGKATITKATGAVTALAIPDTLGGAPVTKIGVQGSVFSGCSGLTSVTIPASVTSIGSQAFFNCNSLTSVNISNLAAWCNITFSTGNANPLYYVRHLFLNGAEITDLVIPGGVRSIGNYAFYNCSGLTSVTIPDTVTSIGNNAFYGCSSLTSVEIASGMTSIGDNAFQNCGGLTTVTIPDSVTSIGSQAFSGCGGLSSVTILSPMASIGNQAFYNCSSLTSVNISNLTAWCGISFAANNANPLSYAHHLLLNGTEITDLVIPDGVTSIEDYAFYNCSGLTSVTIPDSVTNIGASAFQNCSGLTSVMIPDSVTSIGSSAFSGCSGLTFLTIGSGVTSIGAQAFQNIGSSHGVNVSFLGPLPGNSSSAIDSILSSCKNFKCSKQYGAEYFRRLGVDKFAGFLENDSSTTVQVISSSIRDNDPTVMDVVFKVISAKQTVKVRVLAFENGERSFAKVIRPETFIENTAPANWDAVAANVEHQLSWRVSSDWEAFLAKVKFEVLALDGDLMPLELRTIPASDQYGKMQISWSVNTEDQVFDALMWLYADHDPGLTLEDGVLKNDTTALANGTVLSKTTKRVSNTNLYFSPGNAYVLSKMGFSPLEDAPLNYANAETRLGLSPGATSGDVLRQYGYKIVNE